LIVSGVAADEPRAITTNEALPFGQRPVDYWKLDSSDPLTELQRRINEKAVELPFDDKFGFLPAILKELDIPVESQLLAFSSQSPHRNVIRPERPRAVYFNDDVSVSWFPGAVLLECASQDPQKGTLFYTLVNRKETPPEFYRSVSQTCLGCHHMPNNPSWTGVVVPGHLLRSFVSPDEAKEQPYGEILSHTLPIERRWKSWYVTGISPGQKHRGNLSRSGDEREFADDPTYHRFIVDLGDEFDTDRYPTHTSDVVAHLVFNHQMLGLNLLSRYSYEHQFHVRSDIEAKLIRYLLLVDEAPLNKPVAGKSPYSEWYRTRGPKDDGGRSLYELDLETRLFRHHISPLVNCRMVQNFSAELRRALFTRLNDVLTGKTELDGFVVPAVDRQAILAVLKGTTKDWPQ
jgi:hypothetical protein